MQTFRAPDNRYSADTGMLGHQNVVFGFQGAPEWRCIPADIHH